MFPPGWVAVTAVLAPAATWAGVPCVSIRMANTAGRIQSRNIAANTAHPCFGSPAMRPKVKVSANGMASSAHICTRFVSGFGFSNGCVELAL